MYFKKYVYSELFETIFIAIFFYLFQFILCCSANSYNLRAVGETLSQLLLQALQFHPTNVAWLKVVGDLNFGMHTVYNTTTCIYSCYNKLSNYVAKILVI
jgi:hypothetical protein